MQLPVPDKPALEHSQRLCDRISEAIRVNNGFIDFATYMNMAMYEPGLGYYSSGSGKPGAEGDFITAPEISPLFTRCLARQVSEILRMVKNPCVLEAGPGSGEMCCDLLLSLERIDCLPDKYLLLEVSADLRERQKILIESRIPRLAKLVTWLDTLPDKKFNGIILANEVLDAMPVQRFTMHGGEPFSLGVGIGGKKFEWRTAEPEAGLKRHIYESLDGYLHNLPDSYTSEINIRIMPWLGSMADILARGIVLLIDYGYPRHEYYHPQRSDGTMLCHYRHHVHADPFFYPGLQDITASVDFTAVAEAAVTSGLQVAGYTTQAHFLIGCGLDEVIKEMELTGGPEQIDLSNQVRLLTMPGEMGERFKVIALAKDIDSQLTGFRFLDHRSRL